MQLSALLVVLVAGATAIADMHTYANCFSHIQPIGNPNTCNKRRDVEENSSIWERDLVVKRSYADNAAATVKACAAYRNRNTGGNWWDTCPDCATGQRKTSDPNECVMACNSPAKHIGGDEWEYYCKQNGADGAYAY